MKIQWLLVTLLPSALVLVAAIFPLCAAQTTYTAIKPGTVWLADDGVHIDCHGGNIIYSAEKKRYYWYGEHYAAPAGVACYSSSDMYNWVNEGVVLQKGVIQVCERPKVIYSALAKKYVMWFHYDNSNYTLAHLAVATADSATGSFTMQDHFLPNGHQSRDIGMFTDTTGKTYILYSADQTNLTIRMVALSEDYTKLTTNDIDLKAHCEGPGMCKYNGNYYMITSPCLGWAPGRASWYKAPNLTGTYANKGDPSVGDNDHTTFNSQFCYMFKVPGYVNAFMYMGDRWNGSGNKNSQYVFLPVTFTAAGDLQLRYSASWDLSLFTPTETRHTVPDNGAPLKAGVSENSNYGIYTTHGRRINAAGTGSRLPAAFQRSGLYIVVPHHGSPFRVVRP